MLALLGLALAAVASVAVAAIVAATRQDDDLPAPDSTPDDGGVLEVIDATYREGWVYWAGLTEWQDIHPRWPIEMPADTDVTFTWEIRNTGNTGAYFQVYMFSPGDWLYLGPNEDMRVTEAFHTPTLPVTPGYQYALINILARKVDGERIGAVWTSDEIEVRYV